MGILYHIFKEKGIVLAVWDGAVTAVELRFHLRQLLADQDWPPSKQLQLTDLRTMSANIEINARTLEEVVDQLGKFPNKIANLKMALVANEAFQMSTIFQRLMSKYPLTVITFNSIETACTWLDQDVGETELALQQLRARLRKENHAQEIK